MHNIELLRLDVFLGNQVVGGDYILFLSRFGLFTRQC